MTEWDTNLLKTNISKCILRRFGCEPSGATQIQFYRAVCEVIGDILSEKRSSFASACKQQDAKQVYYMSMEFLTGPSLQNHAYHLGIIESLKTVLSEFNISFEALCAMEPDAGLGNGGLGRLASCYLDALTTGNYPCTGFSIRYEFGIFKQKIVDGWQMEFPDNWLERGGVWLIPRHEDEVHVHFGGHVAEHWEEGRIKISYHDATTVVAVPYDMFISGYRSEAVNRLVLWSAKSEDSLDMELFSRGEYVKAMEANSMAEAISKVLYPADDHYRGKELRLKQQYLLVSASVQSILKDFLKEHRDIHQLPEKVAIHINDTHPSLCVPELMRILLDEMGLAWEEAWDLTSRTLSYTNHTIMSEALEVWPISLFSALLPRIYQIVCEIDRRFLLILHEKYGGDTGKINYMKIIEQDRVKMANLCLACCHKVNGVSALHTKILKEDVFRDFHNIMPNKFLNVTNGIAYRRWLCQANPELTAFLRELIGDDFLRDAQALSQLKAFEQDDQVLSALEKIKLKNKLRLVSYIEEHNGIHVDPASLFDVQIKRLHEYKRQLLNALHVLSLYHSLLEHPEQTFQPRTFIFGAKASPGYVMAKEIIRFINCLAKEVNTNPLTRDRLKVIFLEDYRVSLAELIIPATEISEQISVAGKEASGTGNMKLMINGAVTLGTLDGANVEIKEAVGPDNMFLFGMTVEQARERQRLGYSPRKILEQDPLVRQAIQYMQQGVGGIDFSNLVHALTDEGRDTFMTLADFSDYCRAQSMVQAVYGDRRRFNRMSLYNIAGAGIFSADRSVAEYSENIWHIHPVMKGREQG
ncbi:MAG: glycogen/starch/alpha-glucan phosphorylase [Ruminococcaceae bacterium]|nr:glycogen/starch/alpha-glucan phosphorylase [Oscillospiraceae bacterium]